MRLWLRLRRGRPIVVVSGLPRSGTSMMMRMLSAGGLPIVSDGTRAADEGNPHGYFELDAVKRLQDDPDPRWLAEARGRAVKIVSSQLTWLPETFNYQVIFLRRDLDEVLASQEKLLGEPPAASEDRARLRAAYERHLEEIDRFLARRPVFEVLRVNYADAIASPLDQSRRVARFLGRRLNVDAMAAAVDPALYRNFHR